MESSSKSELKPRVLIVEDEQAISTMLTYNLEREGFYVRQAEDGEEALACIADRRPDIILLDWMLPNITGIEICKKLRSNEHTRAIPIIMLTAKGEEADRIMGLDTGADDYIVKPFSPQELISRIKAVLRRMRPIFSNEMLVFEDITMDISSHKVTRNDQEIHLGPKEFQMLQSLIEHPKRILSREQLMARVWGEEIYVEPRTVDVHINRLRTALKQPNKHDPIRTVRAAGYCLQSAEDAASRT